MLTWDEIKKLAANDFSRDCKEIVLTQCVPVRPKVWSGPGTLTMSPSGQLQAKVLISHNVDVLDAIGCVFDNDEPAGTLVSEAKYYDMQATDYWGHQWLAKRLLIDTSVFAPTSSAIVRADLRKITTRRDINKPLLKRHKTVFRGMPKIPFVDMVHQPDGSFRRSLLAINLSDGSTIELRKKDGLFFIDMKDTSQPLHQNVPELVTEAVSIASGCRLMNLYQYRAIDGKSETSIWSAQAPPSQDESDLWAPFQDHMPEPFRAFITEYTAFTQQTPNGFFDYWMKVYDAWQLGAVISALPLAVYIEGVVKEFFPEKRTEPEDFKKEVDAMIALIKMTHAPGDVIKRCVGALERIKDKSTTQALKNLAGEGWFPSELVTAWGGIRHKSAHGHDITGSDEDQQALTDSTLKCLHLFYLLLLIRMQFSQEFHDLSTHGFPRIRLGRPPSMDEPS